MKTLIHFCQSGGGNGGIRLPHGLRCVFEAAICLELRSLEGKQRSEHGSHEEKHVVVAPNLNSSKWRRYRGPQRQGDALGVCLELVAVFPPRRGEQTSHACSHFRALSETRPVQKFWPHRAGASSGNLDRFSTEIRGQSVKVRPSRLRFVGRLRSRYLFSSL